MFSAPSTASRHQPEPAGSRRVNSTSSNPAGSTRISAAVNGRSGGSSSEVTM